MKSRTFVRSDRFAARSRKAAGAAPHWLRLVRAALVLFVISDFFILYTLVSYSVGNDATGILVAVSLTAASVVLPHFSGKSAKRFVERGGARNAAVSGMLLGVHLALLACLTWFRLSAEQAMADREASIAAVNAQAQAASTLTAVTSTASTDPVAITFLLTALLVATAAASFASAFVGGAADPEDTALQADRQAAACELAARTAADEAVPVETTRELARRELDALRRETQARIELARLTTLADLARDPAQAQCIARMLAADATRDEGGGTVSRAEGTAGARDVMGTVGAGAPASKPDRVPAH